LAPGASGADGADGAREQRTGDTGSSCSGIQCALRIRQGEERCRRLRNVVVEPCHVCRLERLRVRHVRRKHRCVGFYRRVCASESVHRAAAIRAQLTLGHVRVLKCLRRRGGHVDVRPVCMSVSAPSAAAACTRLTLDLQLELGYRPRAPARLRARVIHIRMQANPHACELRHRRGCDRPGCENVCVSTHSERRGRTRTKVFGGCGLHKLRRGRGREQPACANARVSKRAGRERRICTSNSKIE
jgi:hypothetical protein